MLTSMQMKWACCCNTSMTPAHLCMLKLQGARDQTDQWTVTNGDVWLQACACAGLSRTRASS